VIIRYIVPSKAHSADLVRVFDHGHDCKAGYRAIKKKDGFVL
jgi:hypothetical protein